jgi:hypothetical protein
MHRQIRKLLQQLATYHAPMRCEKREVVLTVKTMNGNFATLTYIVSSNSSRPMSMRRISEVPAPIS